MLLYKWPNAAWLAFGVIALIDTVTFILLVIAIFCGKFGQAAAGQEQGESEEIRGPDTGKGGYSDIPVLWQERIVEADEEAEVEPDRSFATKILQNF